MMLVIGAALLLPSVAACRTAPARPSDLSGVIIKARGSSVNLRIYTSLPQPGNVLHCLIAALQIHPHARRIRASWSISIGMNWIDTTALYDRDRHRLIVFAQGEGDLGVYHDHKRFTRVPETVFARLAEAHKDDSTETVYGWFDDLPKYGCRKHDLGSWQKDPKN